MKSGGAHVGTSCYLTAGLLYAMHTLRLHMMILVHDKRDLYESNLEFGIFLEKFVRIIFRPKNISNVFFAIQGENFCVACLVMSRDNH